MSIHLRGGPLAVPGPAPKSPTTCKVLLSTCRYARWANLEESNGSWCRWAAITLVMNLPKLIRSTATATVLSRAASLLAAALLLAALSPAARAQSEEGVKAAFLFNFAKLTEWPGAAFADAKAPITVGFVGATGLADTFEKAVTGKNANGRDFAVKKLDDPAAAAGCHIVFVGDAGKAGAVVGAVKGKPVLTVGEEGLADAGGVVAFVKDGAKVTFLLNLAPAKESSLKLDAKLQQIAKSVKGA